MNDNDNDNDKRTTRLSFFTYFGQTNSGNECHRRSIDHPSIPSSPNEQTKTHANEWMHHSKSLVFVVHTVVIMKERSLSCVPVQPGMTLGSEKVKIRTYRGRTNETQKKGDEKKAAEKRERKRDNSGVYEQNKKETHILPLHLHSYPHSFFLPFPTD